MDLAKAKALSSSITSLSSLEKDKRLELTNHIENACQQIKEDLKELYWAIPQDISVKIGASNEKKNVQVTVCAMKHSSMNNGMLTVELRDSGGMTPFCKFSFDGKTGYEITFTNSYGRMTEMPAVINMLKNWEFIREELGKSLELRLLEIQESLKNTISGINQSIEKLNENNPVLIDEYDIDEVAEPEF